MAKIPQPLVEEAIAAIAMGLGSSCKHARAYHMAMADDQGYMGFYKLAVEAGRQLETRVDRLGYEWGETVDFYLATEHLSDKLNDFMIQNRRIPDDDAEWETLITSSIKEARYDRSTP